MRIKPKMYLRALRIDLRLFAEYMGQFKVEYIFALHVVFRYDDYLETCIHWMISL